MRSALFLLGLAATAAGAPSDLVTVGSHEVDYAAFLSRNDVVYLGPAREGWKGMPLGNGNLGAIVWQPDELLLQLNSALSGVYGGAIARLHLKSTPGPLVAARSYQQRLSLHDATLSTDVQYADGESQSQMFIAADTDVLVLSVRDSRPGAVHRIEVETWRPGASTRIEDGAILVADKLSVGGEPDYRFALAVVVDDASPTTQGPNALQVSGDGYTVLAAFAETRDPKSDVIAQAKAKLAAVRGRGTEATRAAHLAWWRQFWGKSVVHLHSEDTVADYLENCWYMHVYAMGAGSRGPLPPKFNGGLWIHDRDQREWGAHYWHWNQQEATWPIFAANHLELHRPYQEMYFGMLPAVKKWTKEMYGLDGAQIQETIPFHGRMPHWPTVQGVHPRVPVPEKFLHTNAILSTSAEVAMQFWWYWRYTGDEAFLREKAYPLMRDVAVFYLGYLEKDARGRYNIWPSNAHESFWRVKNPTSDLAGIRYLFPRVIRAAERLDCDAELRGKCQEALDHLAPYPIDNETGSLMPYEREPGEELDWRNAENVRLFPIGVFPLVTLGSPDYPLALKSFRARKNVNTYGWNTDSITAARLGIADDAASRQLFPGWEPADVRGRGLQFLLPDHVIRYQNYPCGLMDYYPRDPAMHFYLEGSGTAATAVNEMLLQSWEGLIRVAPALPADWNARFTLLAMGGFLVSAESNQGRVDYVSIASQRGGPLRMANPFGERAAVRHGNELIAETDASVIAFETVAGQTYAIVPASRPNAAQGRPPLTARRNNAPKRLGKRSLGISDSDAPVHGPTPEDTMSQVGATGGGL